MSGALAARLDDALERRGGRVALTAGGTKVVGHDLREHARDAATDLRRHGLRTGDTVAILADTSADTLVTILGSLFAGCAYLPLDPTTPDVWRSHLLALAGARLIISPGSSVGSRVVSVLPVMGSFEDQVRPLPGGPASVGQRISNLAYVMGTSGTTGKPKAVPIRESSLIHYCDAFAARVGGPQALADMRMASVTTLAADLGNTMVFPSLLFGGELHLVHPHVARDPMRLAQYFQDYEIDALKVVPTHLRALLDGGRGVLPRRLLVVGGEPFGLDLLARLEALVPECAVFNHYGPTEATVGVAMHAVGTKPGSAEWLHSRGHRSVPIGTALGDNQLRVVDERGDACPPGQLGELVIGGPSVSDGYLGIPDISAPKFVEADWNPGGRVYRTGDLALAHTTGLLELYGRMDRQFKIRGHRVEAVGVEEELRSVPGVIDAFVDHRDIGELGVTLVAWVHAREAIDVATLSRFLADRLPAPMIPSRIILVDSLSRTANGKVDGGALREPDKVVLASAPRSVEDAAVRVFSQVLALPVELANEDFFSLGGHSLAALQAIALLGKDYGVGLDVERFYADPTPVGIARSSRDAPARPSIYLDRALVAPISPQAHSLWTHLRLSPQDRSYEIPVRLRIVGPVTSERVCAAMAELAARHDALRTRFEGGDGRPQPVVDADATATLVLASEASADPQAAGLDFEKGPLMRARVMAIGPDECLVDLLVHHIAYDGVSGTLLVHELASLLGGEALLPVQYARGRLQTSDPEPRPLGDGARANFGLPPARLSSDAPSGWCELQLDELLWSRVEARAAVLGTTPFVIAVAAWALVLSRQDGEPAVTIATPADLRDPSSEDRLFGYYTNVTVVEAEVHPNDTVQELVRRTHLAVGRAIENRHRPYADLVADQRAATGTPPTRTLLAIERLDRASCGDVTIWQKPVARARAVFDVDVGIVVAGQTATLQIHYRVDSCSEGRARSLGEQLDHVLSQFVADPTLPVGDVAILPAAWADRVMGWSRGPAASVVASWGAEAFHARAMEDPHAAALVWPGGIWSRLQLAEAVAHVSRSLRALGLGPGNVVTVAVEQSPALAVAWLAVNEIGAAVMALDPIWPRHRREEAARRAQSDVELTSTDGVTIHIAGAAPAKAPHPSDLSYVILTSGSTGAPKLVAVQRSALANELSWFLSVFPIDGGDCVLAHSSPGFDVAVWEMLGPLSWGACLVFPAMGRCNDVPHLAEIIRDQSVTVIQAVPSLLEALLDELGSVGLRLRLLVSGGEEMPPSLPLAMSRLLPEAILVNTYGPSETAIDVTYHRIDCAVRPALRVPLGRPIAGARAYVLDDRFRLLPPGAFGQLAIGGNAVGRGYLGDPDETERRFVLDPFASRPGERMYLTGDRARWDENGLLEFGGRQDHQVKVRGNRVELQAVEAALRSLPMVQDAVVHLEEPGTMRARLVALVVPRERGGLTASDLFERTSRLLPSYMVPSEFGIVAALPRLSSGKIDREALPVETPESSSGAAAWRTDLEANIARVWTDVLSRQDLVRDLPFFASGGTSLLIPVLQVRLQKTLGVTLSVPELFEHATIAEQAAELDRRGAGKEAETPAAEGRGKLRRDAYAARRNRRNS